MGCAASIDNTVAPSSPDKRKLSSRTLSFTKIPVYWRVIDLSKNMKFTLTDSKGIERNVIEIKKINMSKDMEKIYNTTMNFLFGSISTSAPKTFSLDKNIILISTIYDDNGDVIDIYRDAKSLINTLRSFHLI